jgi:hypothetical protein
MAERIDLTLPFQPDPRSAASFHIARLDLNWEEARISIYLIDNSTGIRRTFGYEGQTALNLIIALNKVDLSVKSLHRRVIERLINDGKLDGTIGGAPD